MRNNKDIIRRFTYFIITNPKQLHVSADYGHICGYSCVIFCLHFVAPTAWLRPLNAVENCSCSWICCNKICVWTDFVLLHIVWTRRGCHTLTKKKYSSNIKIQGGSNMTGTDLCVNKCKQSRSCLNHLVYRYKTCKTLCVGQLVNSG